MSEINLVWDDSAGAPGEKTDSWAGILTRVALIYVAFHRLAIVSAAFITVSDQPTAHGGGINRWNVWIHLYEIISG